MTSPTTNIGYDDYPKPLPPKTNMINITLDLETLSTQENAAIIQIGAAVFSHNCGVLPSHILSTFEATIAYKQCLEKVNAGVFHMSDDTMQWWDAPERAYPRKIVFSGQDGYFNAFTDFAAWIKQLEQFGEVAVWGNGSDFDNKLLSYSLDAYGFHNVWNFRNNRDLRTLRALFPIPKIDRLIGWETEHTALGDARYEERVVYETVNFYPTLKGRI